MQGWFAWPSSKEKEKAGASVLADWNSYATRKESEERSLASAASAEQKDLEEASLLDVIDGACGLFTAEEVELLEWEDDLEMHHLKGYGATINYRMGVALLDDVVQSME